jgi:uncharacterized repeat protein (TIGR04138 family)
MGAPANRQADLPVLDTDRYCREAFEFILEALNHAVERVHGPVTPAQKVVADYMATEEIDLQEVIERQAEGRLDPSVCRAIDEAGGLDNLNRHVSGADLSWAARDFALERWGVLARVVLRTWGITQTADFGNLVFALIESGRLQKEPQDRIEDFHNVYDFQEVFTDDFQLEVEE